MRITRRGAVGAVAAASLLGRAGSAAGAAVPPSIEALTRPPTLVGAALSPDGQTLAILREQRDDKSRIAYVNLVRAADLKAAPVRVVLGDIDVIAVSWASNERLLVSLFAKREETYTPTGSIRSRSYDASLRRMISIGIDGKGLVMLFAEEKGIFQTDPELDVVIDALPDDPQHVLMRAFDRGYGVYGLYLVDLVTGRATLVERGGANTFDWRTQNGRAVLRWDLSGRSNISLYARAPDEAEWKFLRKLRAETPLVRPDLEFVGLTADPGVFLVTARQPGDATTTLRPFDVRTLQLGQAISTRPDRDVETAVVDDHGKYVAARYTVDRTDYDFADPTLAAHFRGMDRFFQGEASVRLIAFDRAQTRFLARASGPRVADAYYLYDRAAQRFEPLGLARPWLSFDSLAKAEALDVRTRDGATIRAYLTVPLASGPRPLLVLPHGGPELRDSLDFDVFAQAFAAQGWLVLQPNFRGSGGYGRAFTDAGRERWGDRMQEDVEDAVAQVLATGRADRQRVAICGASYGGYAALMGAVRRPELYRCAVSIAGVSDLLDMLDYEREDGEDSPTYQYWVRTIGDPKASADSLRQASPRFRAASVAAPVLLIHGLDDRVVQPRQSRLMAQALRGAGKRVEHLELKDVGHRGWKPETLRTVLEQSAKFIGAAFA